MAAPAILEPGECLLYGHRFRLNGPVTENLVSSFPGKIVIGDTTRASDPLLSSYVMETWTGGALRRIMDPAVDIDRFHWATCATWYVRQLTLGPAVRILATPSFGDAITTRQVRAGAVFRDSQWVAWDEKVCIIDSSEVPQAPAVTLAATCTQMFVGRLTTGAGAGLDRLYANYGSGYQVFDGTTWAAGVGGELASYMAMWDDKIIKAGSDGLLKWTTDGVSWTLLAGGVVALPAGSITGLVIYPDANGEDALHITTTDGLYFYDESAGRTRVTRLILPHLATQGSGSTVHQSALYFHSIGAGIDQYVGQATSVAGLNQDDGLPAAYRGSVTCLASTLNWLVASVESLGTQALGTGGSWSGADFAMGDWAPLLQGYGFIALLPTNGGKWHILYAYPNVGSGTKWLSATAPQSKYRLWFGMDGQLAVMDLYPDVLNVLDNNIQKYATTGELWTPWNHMGWSEILKLGLTLELQVDNTGVEIDILPFTPGAPGQQCSVDVYYAVDNVETWNYLGSAPTTGHTTLRLGNALTGMIFRTIRFRYVLNRCEDAFHTPVLRWATLTFLKEIPARYGYTMTVDCTLPYNGVQPEDQLALLRRMADPTDAAYGALLGGFTAWVNGLVQTRQVKLTTAVTTLSTGAETRGEMRLSLISPVP